MRFAMATLAEGTERNLWRGRARLIGRGGLAAPIRHKRVATVMAANPFGLAVSSQQNFALGAVLAVSKGGR